MVTAGGAYYVRLAGIDFIQARRVVDEHLFRPLHVARAADDNERPGGTLLFMSGSGARRIDVGLGIASALTAAIPAFIDQPRPRTCARPSYNLIAASFVDTPRSASFLGDRLEKRRDQLRAPPDRTGRRTSGRRRARHPNS